MDSPTSVLMNTTIASVVKIGLGQGRHSQAWDLEDMTVSGFPGDIVAAEVGIGDVAPILEIIVDYTEDPEHAASYIHAWVTGDATVALEQGIAVLLQRAEGCVIALQILVEAAVRGNVKTLEIRRARS